MREVIDVGENAQKIGKKLEQLGVNLCLNGIRK